MFEELIILHAYLIISAAMKQDDEHIKMAAIANLCTSTLSTYLVGLVERNHEDVRSSSRRSFDSDDIGFKPDPPNVSTNDEQCTMVFHTCGEARSHCGPNCASFQQPIVRLHILGSYSCVFEAGVFKPAKEARFAEVLHARLQSLLYNRCEPKELVDCARAYSCRRECSMGLSW